MTDLARMKKAELDRLSSMSPQEAALALRRVLGLERVSPLDADVVKLKLANGPERTTIRCQNCGERLAVVGDVEAMLRAGCPVCGGTTRREA